MTPGFLGELMGTAALVIMGDGVVAGVILKQTKAENAGWGVITTGWAFAVMIGVFIANAFGSPGADINPAVTIAKAFLTGSWDNVMPFIIAQMIGGILGGIIVWLTYLPHWAKTEDKATKLGVFCTGPAIRSAGCNLITEIVCGLLLVITIFSIFRVGLATPANIAGGLGPYLVAGLVWGIGVSLGGPTGYASNPARDLGPRIAHAILPIPGKGGSDWGYAWIPVFGPIIGGIIAVMLFRFAV